MPCPQDPAAANDDHHHADDTGFLGQADHIGIAAGGLDGLLLLYMAQMVDLVPETGGPLKIQLPWTRFPSPSSGRP